MPSSIVERHVTRICELGCGRVNEIIAQLERGDPPAETDGLSLEEQTAVLLELRAIMAVYRKREGGCG